MSDFVVYGGRPLRGRVAVQGAKNSALPLLAATLLVEGESVLHNCPRLTDLDAALDILTGLGCIVSRAGDTVRVDASGPLTADIDPALMGTMRASVLFLGPLLARVGQVTAGVPGGCQLGSRPIDLHLRAFQALGGQVQEGNGRITCQAGHGLRGGHLALPFPSVGATENAMLAACLASGVTVLDNAAREPEIVDLQGFLQSLGAEVTGAGSSRIQIVGQTRLHPGDYRVMPDRIVTATYLCAVAAAGGQVEVTGTDGGDLRPVLSALRAGGCTIEQEPTLVRLRADHPLQGIGLLTTGPHPAFPTDAQPLLTAALAAGEGESQVTETVFDRRLGYTHQLLRLGARIALTGSTAFITGTKLHGAALTAEDLRGAAALTIAALAAEGESELTGLPYLARGYEDLPGALAGLGAKIEREQ